MHVQKLVFFAHGWHLAIRSEPLIDEQVEAWKFGPVIPSLYQAFREYGSQPITSKYQPLHLNTDGGKWRFVWLDPPSVDGSSEAATFTRGLLDKIWDIYGKYSAIQLSNMTHQPGTPWQVTVEKYGGSPPKHTDIPQEVIRTYFTNLAGRQVAKS